MNGQSKFLFGARVLNSFLGGFTQGGGKKLGRRRSRQNLENIRKKTKREEKGRYQVSESLKLVGAEVVRNGP